MQNKCALCKKDIGADDIGASKKLINRGTTDFYCVECLAARFGVTEDVLREKIEFWRASGCLLFAKKE